MKDLLRQLKRASVELEAVINERKAMRTCIYDLKYHRPVDDVDGGAIAALELLAELLRAILAGELFCCDRTEELRCALLRISKQLTGKSDWQNEKRVIDELLAVIDGSMNPFE